MPSYIEILVSTCIICVLTLTCVNNFTSYHATVQARISAHNVRHIFYYAHSVAITHQKSVVLCPSADGWHCTSSWGDRLLVLDHGSREVLYRSIITPGRLELRCSGASMHGLVVRAHGMAQANGHFTYHTGIELGTHHLYFNKGLRIYDVHGLGCYM